MPLKTDNGRVQPLPNLETERLVLRRITQDDAPVIQEIFSDLAVTRWLSLVPYPYPEGEAERFVDVCQGFYIWAIERRGEPGLIGTIGVDTPEDTRALGFWIARGHWGQGLAGEAAAETVRFAFEDLEATEVTSGFFRGNEASRRIQKKMGFQITGQRMLHSFSNNKELPHIDTVLPRAVWQSRQASA